MYSEKGFGAKIANAKDLHSHLKNFSDYAPPSEALSLTTLETLIETTKAQNNITIDAIAAYAIANDTRKKLFSKEPASLEKRLSSINAAAIAAFGKDSKQFDSIRTITRKIRGTKLQQPGKDPDAAAISNSQRSYGSITQALADLIVILEMHSGQYKTANKNAAIAALQQLHAQILEANKSVANHLGIQARCRDQRASNYKELHKITQRIKEAVKSQYTFSSTEYKLIKSLVI